MSGVELEVPDLVELAVPVGGRVIVMSDLLLGQKATAASESSAADLARAVESWDGPGVVVLAGNCFELLAEPHQDPGRGLAAHPRLTGALARFAEGPGRQVVVLPGNHDAALGWHQPAIKAVRRDIGASVAFAVELVLVTGTGESRVRIEHGHQFDPANAFVDPRDPGETPLGHHVVTDLLPIVEAPKAKWLEGMSLIAEPPEAAEFLSSRLAYRRVAPRLAWLLVPFAIAALMAAAGSVLSWDTVADASLTAFLIGVALAGAVGVGTAWWYFVLHKPLQSIRPDLGGGAEQGNDAPRYAAGQLITEGYRGLVTGHTHAPELTDLGLGFYANAGCGGTVIHRRPGRGVFPPAFSIARHTSWVELEAGASLHVKLMVAHQETPSTTALERFATKPAPIATSRPTAVATWPDGASWPEPDGTWARRRRVRRVASAWLALAGMLNVASATTLPLRSRLHLITRLYPLAVSEAAAVLTVLAGVALLMLARGVRRGQRNAWLVAVVLLSSSVVLHVVKGLDVEEGLFAAFSAVWLGVHWRDFRAQSDEGSTWRSIRTVVLGGIGAVALGAASAEIFGRGHRRLSVGQTILAVAERMVGIDNVKLPSRVDHFLDPTLLATSLGLVLAAGWALFKPVLAARLTARPPEAEEQARRIVAANGGDTLAFFALRDDKRWFFHEKTLVAYAIFQGVCLVSPDPIGPVAERRAAWSAFHQFADDHGWPVCVMGAAESWLPIYRASGMRDLYVGDEAVVDIRRFNLEGGRNKGLRQAVNRIAKYGYTIEFYDPADITDELRSGLRSLMSESRRGEMERGFAMTLSRIFDPDDAGLLLAVCRGPNGEPAAFCHYVPAAAINGYSLDLMRRSEGEHPNGLTDFVVVRTIEHLRELGMTGLGLNFSVMRSVLAGERGDKLTLRVQKWILEKASDSMQIESLWRFNAKFDPDWVARYAVYDAPEHLLASAVAVARAESAWDLPLIGRFFKPKATPELECIDPIADPDCAPDEIHAPKQRPAERPLTPVGASSVVAPATAKPVPAAAPTSVSADSGRRAHRPTPTAGTGHAKSSERPKPPRPADDPVANGNGHNTTSSATGQEATRVPAGSGDSPASGDDPAAATPAPDAETGSTPTTAGSPTARVDPQPDPTVTSPEPDAGDPPPAERLPVTKA